MELFNLLVPVTINCALVLAVYLVDKYTVLKKLPYMAKQVIIGVLFGIVSAFASEYGVELLGTTVNVRDAAPLSAGLIFGAPSGIIAGFIGGTYRWFSVYWGAGMYTRLACTLGTILAGLMAAALRKFMFDNKKPTWGYSVCITIVCEVVHMMLIFLTNMRDSVYAFEFVKGATIPMVIGNVIAVGMSVLMVSALSHEKLVRRKKGERIAQTFQRWLLICIVAALLVTSTFTYALQSGMVKIETEERFKTAVNDVINDVRGKSDENMAELVRTIANHYEALHYTKDLLDLAEYYSLMEVNLISADGFIIGSSYKYIGVGFDMSSTDQSRDFYENVKRDGIYVQEYGPMGKDNSTMRKYAGVLLANGKILQIGYSAADFHGKLDEFVIEVTENRHIGDRGFIAVCDEQMNFVTNDDYNGSHISTIGITPNEQMLRGESATKLYRADIVNRQTEYVEEFTYVFTFVEGYCVIAAMPVDDAMSMRDASIYNSIFMQVLIFATLFIFIYILIKKVIINNLRKINNTLAQITNGNLNVTVDVRTNVEFASLSDDINSTVATLKQYIAEAAARIDRELEYAKQIQLSALPTNFPDNEDYGIRAQMIAAKEVGGDFYDFYQLDENTVAFLAADVSGKGIPAAMFMMTAKTIIKDLAESGMAVNDIFTRANEKLCESNESGMFVTAWMGILDIKTGKLSYANAGHNPPLIMKANGDFEYLRSRAGFVLAGMEGVRYRVNELQLGAGDRIFLYTDGVTEATDAHEQLYGEDRLLEYMNKNKTTGEIELLTGLKANIDEFVGEAPQFDDITMLVFDYRSKKGETGMINRIFPAKTEALGDVLAFFEETLEAYDCPMKTSIAICVAIEEVFVNVAHYAYKGGEGDVSFDVSFDAESRTATFRMADRGVPFDPLARPDPDITLSAEDRDIGGLGIFITKKTMDTVTYAYENGENVLTMIKKI